MKKKISRLLGVGLSLMLLASLMVMVTPASAYTLLFTAESNIPKVADNFLAPAGTSIVDLAVNGDVIYAATQPAATLTDWGNGEALWSEDYPLVGDYSAALTLPATTTADDAAAVVIPINGTMKLSEVEEFVYNFYVPTTESLPDWGGPHMCFYVYSSANISHTADVTLEGSTLGITYTEGEWETMAIDETTTCFWWAAWGSGAGSGSSLTEGIGHLYTLGEFQVDTVFKDYLVDRIQIELGWWGDYTGGTLYVDDVTLNGTPYALEVDDSILYKSTDAGKTWTSLDTSTYYPTAKTIEHVAVAPDDPDIVIASFSDNDVHYSSTGGSSWNDMDQHAWMGDIFDIDVSPGASKKVAVAGANATTNKAQLFTLSLTIAANWAVESGHTGFNTNHDYAKAVKFSPNYSIDKLITVVTGNENEAYFQVFSAETSLWNGEIFDLSDWGSGPGAGRAVGSLTTTDHVGEITGGIDAASIALEPDYLGTDEESRIAFIGIAATTGGGVVRLTDNYKKNFTTWSNGDEGPINSIAYHGAGKLLAGKYDKPYVYYTTSPMASTPKFARLNTLKQPGGEDESGNEMVSVAWSGDTAVAGTRLDESAFAVSTDDGYSWNDISMIDTRMTEMHDVAVSADGSVVYLSTRDGTDTSIWRKGSDWKRVFTIDEEATAPAAFLIRLAPEDSDAVYISSYGTRNMWVSKDGGLNKWKSIPVYKLTTGDEVNDFVVESADVVYAIDDNGCTYTINAGQSWTTAKGLDGIDNAKTISLAPNGDVLVGSGSGEVAFSAGSGASFTMITDTLTDGGTVHVVADPNYADNSKIYAAAGDEFERGTTSKTMSWSGKEPSSVDADNYTATGIAQYEGVVYILTYNGTDSRLYRALDFKGGASADLCYWSYKESSAEFNSTPRALKMSSSTPKFWVVDTDGDALYSMTDPIATVGPTLKSPADGFVVAMNPASGSAYDVTFIWERYDSTSITQMDLQIATDSGFDGIIYNETFGDGTPSVDTAIDSETIAKVVGPTSLEHQKAQYNPGTTYYWRVRTNTPLLSPWSEVRSFTIESTVTFGVTSPTLGATNVPVEPTLVWNDYEGAISYEVMIAEDPTFAVWDWMHSADSTFIKVDEALDYSTTYYWRVRGITGAPPKAGKPAPGGPWVDSVFTTAAAPVGVVEEAPPEVTVEVAPPEVTVEVTPTPAAIPGFLLWTIIGIGAVLFIALIVLIVRTRRVA